jgi:large subunit ribosomal protein L29
VKYKEMAGLAVAELAKKKNEIREQLFQARMKNALGQLQNPMSIRLLRKDIAKINTALASHARGLAAGATVQKVTSKKAGAKKAAPSGKVK